MFRKIRAIFCFSVACTVCTSHSQSELHKPAVTDSINAASSSQGAVAFAWFSQETFDAHFAIDEVVTAQKGWAYYGQLEYASLIIAFDGPFNISRVRVISGVGFDDHTVSAFELHVWPVADPSDESACSVLRERVAAASAGDRGDDVFRDARWARPSSLSGAGPNVSVSQSGRVTVEPAARVAQVAVAAGWVLG
eukprot:CAMPEP_0172159584 /NCGR_PEP_ID=MMETSP1050-20130122/5056_1 /TAXON_ID=233186 /ORGANISM="Cryptomonas curvata, Strain CCAP979/52" /LENGTH=193 /DNA_ID=CAMNT_0012829197 /DNA_START=241 /DNA_END=819 /DNA_ORIENTATION=-